MSTVQKGRNFAVRLYSETEKPVENLAKSVKHYAYILHDKDVYDKDTETHTVGELKKAHYHLLLNFDKPVTLTAVKRHIAVYIEHSGAMVQFLRDSKGGADYLTHDTEEAKKDNKYHYDRTNIRSDKLDVWYSEEIAEQIKTDKSDWSVMLFDDYIKKGYIDTSNFTELVHQYGRDFIFNFSRLMDFIDRFEYLNSNE